MSVSGLNILFVTAHFPYPLIGGERIKQYHILKHLAKNNRIFLVSLDKGYNVENSYINEIKRINVTPHIFHLNKTRSYLSAALFSAFGNPLEIEYFNHREFKNKINEVVKEQNIDLIINFFIRTAEHVKSIPVRKILMAEDCRWFYQSGTSKESRNLHQKAIRAFEARKLRKYEANIMNYFDVTTAVTDEDKNQMRLLNSKAELQVLSNGVDAGKFNPAETDNLRQGIILTGKLDVWINILMIKRIVRNIFPKIKESYPGASLNIVGANPTSEVLKFQNNDIKVHADVPDIVPYLQDAAVFLHPHSGGSGIQNKVLEAMSCGCPVVTTRSGAKGINIRNGHNGFIADSDKEMSEYCREMLINSQSRNEIGENARDYVVNNHSWDSIFEKLGRIISDLFNNKSFH